VQVRCGESLAEESLRVLLEESDRIKDMVIEAEFKARSWLNANAQVTYHATICVMFKLFLNVVIVAFNLF